MNAALDRHLTDRPRVTCDAAKASLEALMRLVWKTLKALISDSALHSWAREESPGFPLLLMEDDPTYHDVPFWVPSSSKQGMAVDFDEPDDLFRNDDSMLAVEIACLKAIHEDHRKQLQNFYVNFFTPIRDSPPSLFFNGKPSWHPRGVSLGTFTGVWRCITYHAGDDPKSPLNNCNSSSCSEPP